MVHPASAAGPTAATVAACFTPGPASCADLIIERIGAARHTIRVQAYYLTSVRIQLIPWSTVPVLRDDPVLDAF